MVAHTFAPWIEAYTTLIGTNRFGPFGDVWNLFCILYFVIETNVMYTTRTASESPSQDMGYSYGGWWDKGKGKGWEAGMMLNFKRCFQPPHHSLAVVFDFYLIYSYSAHPVSCCSVLAICHLLRLSNGRKETEKETETGTETGTASVTTRQDVILYCSDRQCWDIAGMSCTHFRRMTLSWSHPKTLRQQAA